MQWNGKGANIKEKTKVSQNQILGKQMEWTSTQISAQGLTFSLSSQSVPFRLPLTPSHPAISPNQSPIPFPFLLTIFERSHKLIRRCNFWRS